MQDFILKFNTWTLDYLDLWEESLDRVPVFSWINLYSITECNDTAQLYPPNIFLPLCNLHCKEQGAAFIVAIVHSECLLKDQLQSQKEWQRDALITCNPDEFITKVLELPSF